MLLTLKPCPSRIVCFLFVIFRIIFFKRFLGAAPATFWSRLLVSIFGAFSIFPGGSGGSFIRLIENPVRVLDATWKN